MATLIINDSNSRCGNCGNGADPIEARHLTRLPDGTGKGCGVKYTEVGTESLRPSIIEGVRLMRPDLIFIGQVLLPVDSGQSN